MLTKKERKCNVILNTRHSKILYHAFYLRVAYIILALVYMGH